MEHNQNNELDKISLVELKKMQYPTACLLDFQTNAWIRTYIYSSLSSRMQQEFLQLENADLFGGMRCRTLDKKYIYHKGVGGLFNHKACFLKSEMFLEKLHPNLFKQTIFHTEQANFLPYEQLGRSKPAIRLNGNIKCLLPMSLYKKIENIVLQYYDDSYTASIIFLISKSMDDFMLNLKNIFETYYQDYGDTDATYSENDNQYKLFAAEVRALLKQLLNELN